MKIQSLATLPFSSLFEAFSEAFQDYEIHPDANELQTLLTRRGFDPALSFGAFDGSRLVSFTFNGTGMYQGIPTAYDTGTGTLKDYRGKGLAGDIFRFSLPFLKEAGWEQYLLEVLQHNTKAISVYEKLGFLPTREFSYFRQNRQEIRVPDRLLRPEFKLQEISWKECIPLKSFGDHPASWQNSFEAIAREAGDFRAFGIIREQTPVAYCIFETLSGDITQLAVNPSYRRQGLASALLSEALQHNRHAEIKLINADVRCSAVEPFLLSFNIPLAGRQFEMIRKI